jgi:large subunit GTPase 1
MGNPDEARAARFILKDYVNGKILYCHPPPDVDPDMFNEETHARALRKFANKKRGPTTHVNKNAVTYLPGSEDTAPGTGEVGQGHRSKVIDGNFFADKAGLSATAFVKGGRHFTRARIYPHQNAVADDGASLTGRRARIAAVLTNAGDAHPGKKDHKKGKRVKQRSGKGYE